MPLTVTECKAKFDDKRIDRRNCSGHSSKVHTLAWNRDGTKLASGSGDKTTRVWDLAADSKLSTSASQLLTGHAGAVDQLCWDPTNPNLLATASSDKTVRIWDLRQSPTPCTSISTIGENINIAWNPEGTYIAVGNKDDVITMIDARKFKASRIQKFAHEVNEFAWDTSGKFLFMTTELGTVEIFTHDLKRVKSIHAHPSNIYCIDFDSSGKYFAIGSADAIVSLFTLPELICVRTFTKLEYAVRAVSFTHESSMITSAAEDLFIDTSHVTTGEHLHNVETNAPSNAAVWNPRDFILAYAGEEKERYNDAGNVRLLRCAA